MISFGREIKLKVSENVWKVFLWKTWLDVFNGNQCFKSIWKIEWGEKNIERQRYKVRSFWLAKTGKNEEKERKKEVRTSEEWLIGN